MNNKCLLLLGTLFIVGGIFTSSTIQVDAAHYDKMPFYTIEITSDAAPRADVIKWRYKTVNNILYKRQYNYTQQQWIGEWERY